MKGNFLPYKYAKMLKGLEFNEKCSSSYNTKGEIKQFDIYNSEVSNTELDEAYKKQHWQHKEVSRPLWQQTEEWLWEKHGISIEQSRLQRFENTFHCYFDTKEGRHSVFNTPKRIYFESPITAHREGIIKAIEYIHSQTNKP